MEGWKWGEGKSGEENKLGSYFLRLRYINLADEEERERYRERESKGRYMV